MRTMRLVSVAIFVASLSPLVSGHANPQGQGGAPAAAPTLPAPITPPAPIVPEGFTPLFNGSDLTGWHVSKTNHHGTNPDFHVEHGLIVGTQRPFGHGNLSLPIAIQESSRSTSRSNPTTATTAVCFFNQ